MIVLCALYFIAVQLLSDWNLIGNYNWIYSRLTLFTAPNLHSIELVFVSCIIIYCHRHRSLMITDEKAHYWQQRWFQSLHECEKANFTHSINFICCNYNILISLDRDSLPPLDWCKLHIYMHLTFSFVFYWMNVIISIFEWCLLHLTYNLFVVRRAQRSFVAGFSLRFNRSGMVIRRLTIANWNCYCEERMITEPSNLRNTFPPCTDFTSIDWLGQLAFVCRCNN